MHILLLEDDAILSDIMRENLELSGFLVDLMMDGEAAIQAISNHKYDLFLFDINVPIASGLEVLKFARTYHYETPTIMITAYQDINHLKESFQLGCDDYIKKPFEYEELEQRIDNIKRHFNIENNQLTTIAEGIHFNFTKQEVVNHKRQHHLSQKEAEILNYLFSHRSRVISNEELMQNIWIYDEIPSDATLRVYIKNLRNIIGKEYIKTIRGRGYCFEER
jgi:DNA-binding response OmpR family regulator